MTAPETSRIRGDLYERYKARKLGERALSAPLDVAEVLPGLTGEAEASTAVLGDKATLITGADVAGLWHYSGTRIDRFTEDKASGSGGKFGRGTYFGVGEISGETVDALINGGNVRHEAGFSGNMLAFDRNQVRGVLDDLRSLQGLSQPNLRSSMQTGPVTDLVEGAAFDGHSVDAVMIYMDPERQGAEIIVLPHATENIRILGA
jgi:hypothetical protein